MWGASGYEFGLLRWPSQSPPDLSVTDFSTQADVKFWPVGACVGNASGQTSVLQQQRPVARNLNVADNLSCGDVAFRTKVQ